MAHLDYEADAEAENVSPLGDNPSGTTDTNGSAPSDSGEPPSPEKPHNCAPAIHDVAVDVYAILGQAAMPVSQLLRMGRGAVVELNSRVGDQVQIMVNHTLIARGEIVVVHDRIAIEITEVVRRERD
jgi:flagellar motor switch protein FliN/FliY